MTKKHRHKAQEKKPAYGAETLMPLVGSLTRDEYIRTVAALMLPVSYNGMTTRAIQGVPFADIAYEAASLAQYLAAELPWPDDEEESES